MVIASETADVITEISSSPALGCSSSVPCSICFDLVIDDGERSTAKLHCGHKFHLDCIGSAFNSKGTMQCPNCRKVESGRWLFADGSAHGFSETRGEQDWLPYEGPHDLSYFRRPFRFHWCPFSGFTVHSSIEEAEPSLNTWGPPSSAHSYISFFGNSNFHLPPVNSISAPRNNLHAANIQHPSWGWNCHFLPYNADRDFIDHADLAPGHPARSARGPTDAVGRSFSLLHPLHYTQHVSVATSQSHERNMVPSSTIGLRRGLPVLLPAVRSGPDHHPRHHHHHRGGGGGGAYIRESSFYRPFSRGFDHSNRAHRS